MITCDDCGKEAEVTRGWSELQVKPKGIFVTLNLCCRCTEKREPQEPDPDPEPKIQETRTPYQVTGYLLWASDYAADVHFPTRRTSIVTFKKTKDDRTRVMQIFEDTEEGKRQLTAVVDFLSDVYRQLWRDSTDHGLNHVERVKWCSEHLFHFTPRYY